MACDFRTGVVWLRHRQFPGGEHPSTTVPYSSTTTPSSTTSLVHRFKSHVLCGMRHGLFEGMVATGKFRSAPDQSCSYFTIANIHINSECAKRRSVCIALLLLIRELCLTGDFNKAVERETPSGDGERRTSPMEGHANIPWPTFGVNPLWGPRGEPNGFVVLPESQSQWLIWRHGSINVVPAAIPHLAMAPSQVRGVPCGLKVAPEDCAAHQEVSDRRRTVFLRKLRLATCVGFLFKLCGPHRCVVTTAVLWDQRCLPRCIQLHALRMLLLTAFGNVSLHCGAGACLPQGRSPLVLSHAVGVTTCSLRASFFEHAGGQLVASPRATHFCFLMTPRYSLHGLTSSSSSLQLHLQA